MKNFNGNNKGKDKDLDLMEFLEILQYEYFQCEVKKKINPSPADKRYYQKVMVGKERKIKDIAKRNGLESIFSSEKVREKFYDMVYKKGRAIPEVKFTAKELDYYYSIGASFKSCQNPLLYGKCVFVGDNVLIIETPSGEEKSLLKGEAIRIL